MEHHTHIRSVRIQIQDRTWIRERRAIECAGVANRQRLGGIRIQRRTPRHRLVGPADVDGDGLITRRRQPIIKEVQVNLCGFTRCGRDRLIFGYCDATVGDGRYFIYRRHILHNCNDDTIDVPTRHMGPRQSARTFGSSVGGGSVVYRHDYTSVMRERT